MSNKPLGLWDGITPAGAGKTYRQHEHAETAEDHPRRCGENKRKAQQGEPHPGSPPQVRGKRESLRVRGSPVRITPAGAGKTTSAREKLFVAEDHPRRCGENIAYSARLVNNKGSPPQVRGKLTLPCSVRQQTGITPAGAGKTVAKKLLGIVNGDHPRRCGENRKRNSCVA